MIIESLVWYSDHWVKFRLILGDYENIITFLEYNELSFLKIMNLDFTQIPFLLHGKGNSKNLLQYLANNTEDNILITQFIDYFLKFIIKMKYYYSGENVVFYFGESLKWQNTNVNFYNSEINNNYVENGYIDNYFE
jgi:hypothetical protein